MNVEPGTIALPDVAIRSHPNRDIRTRQARGEQVNNPKTPTRSWVVRTDACELLETRREDTHNPFPLRQATASKGGRPEHRELAIWSNLKPAPFLARMASS